MPTILLKKSDTPGSVPGTANLTNLAGGVEVAVNTADKRVYSMTSASAVIELGTNPSSLTCADASFTLLKAASASITNLTATSLVLSNLSIASANITTLTSSSATITNLIATSASITTLTNNPTFGAGTANGVLYLNGSKVATSGTALVFDGTDFKMPNGGSMLLGASASGASLVLINGTAAAQRLVLGTSGTDAVINATRTSGTNPNLLFQLEGANSMALTSTGLGIGTSSPGAKLHVLGSNLAGIFAGTNANTVYTEYRYNSTTTSGFIGNGSSLLSAAADSDFIVRSEGALKFATNGNNFRAVIDTSGNLIVGGTSPVISGAGRGNITINGSSSAIMALSVGGSAKGWVYHDNTNLEINAGTTGAMIMYTASTERGRFTAGGYFKASNDGTYESSTGSYHEARQSASGERVLDVAHTHASNPYGIQVKFTAASPDNNTNWFFVAQDATTTRCYIWSDGDLANHDGVYGTISDERLKQDIVDASSQWDDLKAIRFRKYRMKTDVEANPDAPAMFGVVAQELAQVCPGLVDEHPNMKTVEVTDEEGNVTQTQEPDGTTTMTVKSSILLMKAAKALQEAMARIESLEAKVAALEAK